MIVIIYNSDSELLADWIHCMESGKNIDYFLHNKLFIFDKKKSLQGSCCTSSRPHELFGSSYHNFSKLNVMNPFQLQG